MFGPGGQSVTSQLRVGVCGPSSGASPDESHVSPVSCQAVRKSTGDVKCYGPPSAWEVGDEVLLKDLEYARGA